MCLLGFLVFKTNVAVPQINLYLLIFFYDLGSIKSLCFLAILIKLIFIYSFLFLQSIFAPFLTLQLAYMGLSKYFPKVIFFSELD